ncbi:MAG: GNAT family N-acetyltransferase [Archangium sp.]|nr:GNAT family N-acetyltransferase [Archangium sp.]
MHLQLDGVVLRPVHPSDEERLVLLANDRNVWRNMRDLFPHPYTRENARWFIEHQQKPDRTERVFAIEVDGQFAGATGVHPLTDVYSHGAEIGYWLGAPFHGRGIATKAVGGLTKYAFEVMKLERLQAGVFEWNPASARVLEKNGFQREAVLKKSVFKDGQLIDSFLYAKLRG